MITIAEQARARIAAEKAIKSWAVTKNSNGTYTINSWSKAGTTVGTSSWWSGGSSSKNLRQYNFVDPSVLQDAQSWISTADMAAKWGTSTQQMDTMLTNNEARYGTYYNGSTYKSTPTLTKAAAPTATASYTPDRNRYAYSNKTWYYEKVTNPKWLTYQEDEDYYGTLYDKDKFSPDATYEWDADPDWLTSALNDNGQYGQNVDTNIDLTGGEKNTNMNSFGAAVNNKLQTAFGIQNMSQLKEMYPEQYSSLVQSLNAVAGTWNALDPSQRQLLDWQLQAIIWTAVGAGSDTSKLNVLNESMMNKFEDGERVAQDMKDIINLQTKWMSTEQIADRMWISEDQVQQAVLAYNWLDNRLWEYYKLKEWEANEITEDFDKQRERLEEEKRIQLERANRQIEWLKEDFDKNLDRQKKANEINEHNADFLAGQYWFWFSKRGMEWLNYVTDQAKQIIDDMVTNYDRTNQEMADWVADIIRNWEWNNEDLLKASEDALTQAKNNYTSNMLAIQQQYGTVWMQAQQQLANNVQAFITQAESIYDNALTRQQQNLSNLITNFSNLNALQYSNLTLRNAQIQQFQAESMNMNRSQLQGLAQQLWMDTNSFQDLVNYQVQAVANELNWYIPWAWAQLQGTIQSLLNQWYTPNQALQSIMNSDEFKNMQATSGEWTKLNDTTLYDKATGKTISIWGSGASGANYVSSQTVDGQTYGVSQNTLQWLQNFYNNHQIWSQWGQCGAFVNDYLQSIGVWRIFTDPITDKQAQINTPEWYTGQIWDVIVMDSPSQPQYWHTAIITWVNSDWTYTTLESNKKWEEQVFSRTIDPNKTKVYWFYHPDGAMQWGSNMSDYDINTATMRLGRMAYGSNISNTESERVEKVLRDWMSMWKDQTQILYDILWMTITKNQDKAEPLINIMIENADSDWLKWYDTVWFANLINSWKIDLAVNKVEKAVADKQWIWKDFVDNEASSIAMFDKWDRAIELINNNLNKLWIVAGNWNKQKSKFLKNQNFQQLESALTSLVADWRHQMAGSAVTETELKMIDSLIPNVKDNPYNAIQKIQELQNDVLARYNSQRWALDLPYVDQTTLKDKKQRVNLYYWGSTSWGGRWLQGTIDITNRWR